jgi:hypothetical protein
MNKRLHFPENCFVLGCYTAISGNLLPTFQDKLSVQSSRVKNVTLWGFLALEDWTDTLSRNVGNKSSLKAA